MEYIKNFTDHLVQQSWQIAVLFLIVAVGSFLLRNKSSHWRYLLWCVILAKCLLPPVMTFKAAVLPFDAAPSNSAVIEEQPPVKPAANYNSEIENRELNNQKSNLNIQTISNNQNSKLDSRLRGNDTGVGRANQSGYAVMDYIKEHFYIFVFTVWGVGAIAFLVVAGVKAFLLNRWILRHRQLPGEDVSGEIEKLKTTVSSEFLGRIWVVEKITQPFVWGLWRGCAYLPAGSKNSADVIMHELAHIIRLDAFVNLLQIFAQAIFWFHPFVWIANNRIRAEREKSCDEIAIARLKVSPRSYSSAVVDVLVREYQARKALPSLAVAGPVKNIEERIRTVMAQGKKFYSRPTTAAVITVLVLAAICVPTTIAITKAEPEKKIATESTEGTEIEKTKQGDFKATLSNGTTIELISVCEHPSKGKQWWRADGEIIKDMPYEIGGNIIEPIEGYQRIDLIVRIDANEQSHAVKFIVPGATRSGAGRNVTINQMNVNMDMWAVRFEIDSMLNSADVKAGVASGEWQTISKIISSFKNIQRNDTDFGQIEWLKVIEENNEVTIYVSNNFSDKAEFQIIAEDIIGETYPSYTSHCKGNAGLMSCEYKFHLSPDKAKEFKFQIRPYQWVEFKNVSLKPNFKTDVQIGTEKGKAIELTEDTKGQKTESMPTQITPETDKNSQKSTNQRENEMSIFESYFPEDEEAGKKLDEWWKKKDTAYLDTDTFFELFRKGIRKCTIKYKDDFPMQYIGGNYIWNKEPDDQRAIEIVYYASFSPEYKYYAVYSGLSVANPKSEKVLKRLVDIALEYHQLGRIIWGTKQSKQDDEFIAFLEPYLHSSDAVQREHADIVAKAFRGEIDGDKWEREWNRKQQTEKTIREFGDDLPKIKKIFLTGTSEERQEILKFVNKNGITLFHDASFIAALGECAKDRDEKVRRETARILGSNFIWGHSVQPQEAIEILLQLSKDQSQDVRYQAVYFGLSVITNKDEQIIKRLVEMAMNENDNSYFVDRIRWGLTWGANKDVIKKCLAPYLDIDGKKGELARDIYQEIYKEPFIQTGTQTAAGQDANETGELQAANDAPAPTTKTEWLEQKLSKKITVDIDKGPSGKLTVQYAVIAVCEAVGMPYKWDISAKLADPQRRSFIAPLHIKDKTASEAITDILKPFGLNYAIGGEGLFIYKNQEQVQNKEQNKPEILQKDYVPETSTVDANGRIVDKIDYPFVDDQQAIGRWISVDFVDDINDFQAGSQQRGDDLFFKELVILPQGKTNKPWWTWTKGLIFHSGDNTASKYIIKHIGDSDYMFFEWKSGDYTIRGRKPEYYVLQKEAAGIELPIDLKAFDEWSMENFKNLDGSENGDSESMCLRELKAGKGDDDYWAIVISRLGYLKSKKAIPDLAAIAFGRQGDNKAKWMAVRSLGLIGDKAVMGDLIHLMYHYNSNVRLYARVSLVRLAGRDLGPDWQKWAAWHKNRVDNNFSTKKIEWTTDKKMANEKLQMQKDQVWLKSLVEEWKIKNKYNR